MRIVFICWLVTQSFFVFSQSNQAQAPSFNRIKEAIQIGNAHDLANYFDENVQITIESDINSYSKTQAEFVLRNFFKKYEPSEFSILHTGSSRGGSQYAIGSFVSKGAHYTVLIRIRKDGANFVIHEMSFVRE